MQNILVATVAYKYIWYGKVYKNMRWRKHGKYDLKLVTKKLLLSLNL